MIPQQHQSPPMHYQSPLLRPPLQGTANGMTFSQPSLMATSQVGYMEPLMAPPQPKSPLISTFQNAGKVMDIETSELLKTPVNAITPSAGKNHIIHRKTTYDTRFILPNSPKGPNPNSPRGPKCSEPASCFFKDSTWACCKSVSH
jgi:hypothetical protein